MRYDITEPGWTLSDTHLHIVDTTQADIPQKKGNPIPGQFDYATPDEGDATYAEFRILLDAPAVMSSNGKKTLIPAHNWIGDLLTIAAHGVVEQWGCDVDLLPAVLPGMVDITVIYAAWDWYNGTDFTGPDLAPPEPDLAYFSSIVISNGIPNDLLDGTYIGWCIDYDLSITGGLTYPAGVYSSYHMLPALDGLVNNPEDMDLVNYILNQDIVGQPSGCDGVYTYGDVQQAIWYLLEDRMGDVAPDFDYPFTLGPWELCRANEIIDDAVANGDGFEPGCDEYVGIIIIPDLGQDGTRQAVLIPVMGPGGDETVWGGLRGLLPETDGNGWGSDFTGSNWGMYFPYSELVPAS